MIFVRVFRITFYLLKCQENNLVLDSLRCSKLTSGNKTGNILLDIIEVVKCSYTYTQQKIPFFTDKLNQYTNCSSKESWPWSHTMVLAVPGEE